ncbi:MAG TPA: hypothetical protein VLA16_27545, partial [Ideonella sp.]|nr:hypothetical protein [Ideonella sp.]
APPNRAWLFAAVVGLCAAGAAGYAAHVALRREAAATAAPAHAAAARPVTALGTAPGTTARLLYRSTALGETYGRVMLAELGPAGAQHKLTPLQCERVHFAAGHGVCLQAKRGVITTYQARLFNAAFELTQRYELAGPPSRARVSPDGRLAAMTVFVSGHGYSNGDFTTRTSVIDAHSGRAVVDDLESFSVTRDGAPFKAANFNFWGVTFARDANRFYATLGSGEQRYLVEGDLAARRMRVVHDAVECPSLSPDNRRIAFKRRLGSDSGGRVTWRLYVLDLASATETALQRETRNVDDQVEWLNDDEIVYALPDDSASSSAATSSWALAADGSAEPRPLLPFAFSPAVLRD